MLPRCGDMRPFAHLINRTAALSSSAPGGRLPGFATERYNKDFPCGPVAQLGARMNGIHEVTGSIPVWSTNLRSMIQAEVVHHSLAKMLSQATVDLPTTGSELRLAGQVCDRSVSPTR
jgi:hypothetical protein